ncbi:glycosyltransferase [Streptomyces lateritius]|uniref:glycosyltransferase n=1 Tax=Streptomyces lateritius TaxID=67313 RepID=UPI001C8C8D33|nr:nucleotide disphospho-sugar-binding domain-containing protein [Streptomyces lateritius]MBX9427383.1 hypothetical protein [Streptomyces lateritius]
MRSSTRCATRATLPSSEPRRARRILAAGPPPVFAGFGSFVAADAERLSTLLADAFRRARVRGIIQSGWSGLRGEGDDLVTVQEVPHAWLFTKTAAVVHHAGAGTTAAGIRAGVPAIAVPVQLDQHFWAARLHALGVSPPPLRYQRLTAQRLSEAIVTATRTPELGTRARRLATDLALEDGARHVHTALERLAQPLRGLNERMRGEHDVLSVAPRAGCLVARYGVRRLDRLEDRFGAWLNQSRRRMPRRPSAHRLTIMWKAPAASVIMEA